MPTTATPPARTEQDINRLLTIKEFHRLLGGALGINAIRRAIHAGRIRSLLVGERKRLIPSTELVDWPRREIEANS